MSSFPLKAFQESVSSLQRIWQLERELIRLKAQTEFRQRLFRMMGLIVVIFLIISGLTLAIFWGSVGILQAGRPLWQVVALSSGPLLLLAALILLVSKFKRHSEARHAIRTR